MSTSRNSCLSEPRGRDILIYTHETIEITPLRISRHMTYLIKEFDQVLQSLEGAHAPNTLKSYYADARAFVDWCEKRNIEPFPISSETLCTYIECLQARAAFSFIRWRIA